MSNLYFLCGIQGSGKTTFAITHQEELKAIIVSTDGIRNEFPNLPEKEVFPTAYKRCAEFLNENKNVIFDATNINASARIYNLQAIKNLVTVDLNTTIYVMETNLKECESRVAKRNRNPQERFLPIEVISSYLNKYEKPTKEEGFQNIVFIK